MIKVECFSFRGKSYNPQETFIVKNPEKIKLYKALEGVGYFWEIRVTEIKKNG